MKRYIEREALIAFLNEDMVFCKHTLDESPFSKGVQTGLNAGINYATVLDAADVVEVVRCKDCKWRNTRGCPYMNFNAEIRADLDFCSDGERRADHVDM